MRKVNNYGHFHHYSRSDAIEKVKSASEDSEFEIDIGRGSERMSRDEALVRLGEAGSFDVKRVDKI